MVKHELTITELNSLVRLARDEVFGLEDVLHRYRMDQDELERMILTEQFPKPVTLAGKPRWFSRTLREFEDKLAGNV